MLWNNFRDSKTAAIKAAVFFTFIWILFHLIFYRQFIFHDAWQHVFPITFAIASQSNCAIPTSWLGSVDNGSSSAIYLISMSLTQLFQLPFIAYVSCIKPTLLASIYGFKIEIMTAYAVFSFGMLLMGLKLFHRKLSAIYLFVITLFSGMCLDNLHSSQIIAIIFWLPWIVLSYLMFNSEKNDSRKIIWVNGCILLICAQLLDQYPHFLVITLFFAILIFIIPNRDSLKGFTSINLRDLLPALFFIFLTVGQLWVIRTAVDSYQPSLRSSLTVSPEQFGETGFLQITAFLTTFFPLTILSNYEIFANGMAKFAPIFGADPGMRLFIYRLDTLLLLIGVLPIIFCFYYIVSQKTSSFRRSQLLLFIVAIALVAIQQSKIYYLLFYIPFFNIFRSYFLFTPLLIMGLLVLSAFGFDLFITSNTSERKLAGKKSLLLTFALIFIFAVILLILWNHGATSDTRIKSTAVGFLIDCLIILTSFLIFWKACKFHMGIRLTLQLIAIYILSQLFILSGAYYLVGENIDTLLKRYDSGNKISIENIVSSNDTFTKYSCTYFASCYLSFPPSASLNTDLNGTFLRNKNEPIFYSNEIGLEQAKKLMGIEGNPVWIDTTYTPVKSYVEVASLIKNKTNIDKEELPNFIHTNQAPPNNKGSKLSLHAQISKWSSEKIDISYSAPISSYIFLPINFDKNWKATIGDQSLNIYAANLGGLAINAPASSGKNIVLKRNDPEVNFLWASRIALILLSGCFLIFLIRMTLKEVNR